MICFKFFTFLILYIFASPIDTTSGGDFISDDELKDIRKILIKNGHNNLIFVSLDYRDLDTYIAMTRLSLSLRENYQVVRKDKEPPQKCYFEECYYTHWFKNIPSSPVMYLSKTDMSYRDKQTLVFFASSVNSDHFEFYLKEISQRSILSTVLIMTNALTSQEVDVITSRFNMIEDNAMFFWLYRTHNHTKTAWNRVISLKGYRKTIMNRVQINDDSKIKEEYDLQGLHLTSISLSWFPYFYIHNCNDNGTDCESVGYLKQFMDSLGTLMNFTWESHKEMNDDWGLSQQDDGSWGGVVGHVLNGSYQLSVRYY